MNLQSSSIPKFISVNCLCMFRRLQALLWFFCSSYPTLPKHEADSLRMIAFSRCMLWWFNPCPCCSVSVPLFLHLFPSSSRREKAEGRRQQKGVEKLERKLLILVRFFIRLFLCDCDKWCIYPWKKDKWGI